MNKKTIAIFAVSMVLVCALSVFTTLALLTSTTETVTNTFTSGKVKITLNEAPVGDDGKATISTDDKANAGRVLANSYKFTPTAKYDKDPTITVESGSENSYVGAVIQFNNVPVVTEDGFTTLLAEYGITLNSELKSYLIGELTEIPYDVDDTTEGVKNVTLYTGSYVVYFDKVIEASNNDTYLELFDGITMPDFSNDELAAVTKAGGSSTINVTAYAVQSDSNDDNGALAALKESFDAIGDEKVVAGE